jgi:integrase
LKVHELASDRIIKTWLSTIKASQETRNSYLQSMHFYTDFFNMTPEQLLEEAENEQDNIRKMRNRLIVQHILSFREFQESKVAPTTSKTRLAAVYSFYKNYDINLPILPKSDRKARPALKRREIPKKEEIREILKFADSMEKAIMLVGCSSGLSAVDITNLKIGDFYQGYDHDTEVTTFHIIRQKTGIEFYTFLTPEASRAVLEYLKWRNNYNEITKVVSEDGYLFIKKYILPEYLQTKDESLRKLNKKAIIERYSDLNKLAGTNTAYKEYNRIRSHTMRKYFNSTLINNGCNPYQTDLWMGHDLGESKGAYIVPQLEEQKKLYTQYMHLLTIEKQFDPSDSLEFKQMQAENERLARITAKTAVERDELQELRAEMEKMKEASASAGSIKEGYMQFADMNEIIEMKNALRHELEEISKLKEMMLENRK